MRKKSTTLSPLKRPSTRSLSINKQQTSSDKYTFQSDDDEDYNKKPTVFIRKNITPTPIKRSRGRPPKTPKIEDIPKRISISSSTIESDSDTEENSLITKRKHSNKYSYEKPVTRRASRLVSQTNTSVSEKINSTPKKRGRKPKMLNINDNNNIEQDKSKQQIETENMIPPQSIKRRYIKKKTLSTDTNPKIELNEYDEDNNNNNNNNNNQKISTIDEKDLMQFGSPQQHQQQSQVQQHQIDDDFSDDSVEFVWKGSSKMSIEILKRRIPKDEPRDLSSNQIDPTAQRKRAIIPRLTNFDALSGQPIDNTTTIKRDNIDQNLQKKSTSVITLNNVFQNDFVPSYNDTGTKMTTTTTTTTTEEKPRPRIYAVKSTTMKSRPQQPLQQQQQQQQQQPEIKRPKWMNDQQEKSEDDDDDNHNLPPAGEEPNDFDYIPKGQYIPKRPNYRGRGTYPGRRGTGMRGRPPGSRRQWHDDDDDDDYDQYEEMNSRYGPRKQSTYRSTRPMYDMGGGEDDDYDRNHRMSLTQAYRRNNMTRPPLSSMSGQRRIAINNGNHPIYKPYKSSSYRPTPATLGLSTSSRRTSSTSRSPVSTISKSHHHLSSTISKHYSDDDYYHQQTRPTTINNTNNNNTFVTKMNDTQLNDVSNQSQIFFVNMPQQEQKHQQQQQVLSVLTSDQQQQQQQQVLPVTVVQQVKLPVDVPKQKKILPKPSSTNQQVNTSNEQSTINNNKPFSWSRPPGRVQSNHNEQMMNKNINSTSINTDLDTMEAAHVLATAADVTMAADARRKAQQHDDDMTMMVDETPSNIAGEETIQCDDNTAKVLAQQQQQLGTITANIIDENGVEHTVLLSAEEAQQLLGSQGAIIVDSDGQPISIQQAQPQTFVSPFALDQAQLQALLVQAGIDPNTPLTIEQVDPNQQQQIATLCTSPGGTQYTVLTQGSTQQQFILQTTNEPILSSLPIQTQTIAPKEEISTITTTTSSLPSPPAKRRAFAVKSTVRSETYDDLNERPRRKIFATKSTVTSMNDEIHDDQEGFIDQINNQKQPDIIIHPMTFLRTLITFSLGVYTGVYTSQNYEVPKVDSPKELYERLAAYVSTYKKKSD
ncbi:unnamed protein product [Rotaria sp. Silwood1]|nr:unnamed protein product [Rotaria sp. Silwood1]CAF4691273.1 unnamed protein product [Rotaria sp. Silwood1]